MGGARETHRPILCDTNVIVRILTADQPVLARAAAQWLDDAAPRSVVVTDIVVAETGYVLTSVYNLAPTEAAGILAEFISLPCIDVSDHVVWLDALDLWGQGRLDLANAHLAAIARRVEGGAVLSFDKDFDRVEDVARIDPRG